MSAATVTAVAAVAGAGVAAYGSYSQGKQAEAAAEQAKAGNKDLYGSKVKPEEYKDRIGTPESYANIIGNEVNANVRNALPGLIGISREVNQENMRRREKVTGGQFKETIRQEGANISSMLQGQLPADVISSINRMVAENVGGAFNPGAGGPGGSNAANDFARKLGLTSLDVMSKGMSFAPAWRSNVDSFIYKPQDAMRDFYSPMANLTLDASRIQMARDESEYMSANNIARAEAMPDPGAVGSFRDSLTLGALENQAMMNTGNALIGLVNSGAAAYNTFAGPSANTGVHSSAANAQAAAPYAGGISQAYGGYVPRATAVSR